MNDSLNQRGEGEISQNSWVCYYHPRVTLVGYSSHFLRCELPLTRLKERRKLFFFWEELEEHVILSLWTLPLLNHSPTVLRPPPPSASLSFFPCCCVPETLQPTLIDPPETLPDGGLLRGWKDPHFPLPAPLPHLVPCLSAARSQWQTRTRKPPNMKSQAKVLRIERSLRALLIRILPQQHAAFLSTPPLPSPPVTHPHKVLKPSCQKSGACTNYPYE